MARSGFIKTPNAQLIVSLDEAKTHLRIVGNDDDAYITNLIFAARDTFENYTNTLPLLTSCFMFADAWFEISTLYFSPLPNSGKAIVNQISYYDADDVQQILPTTEYIVDASHSPIRIGLSQKGKLPALSGRINQVEVAYEVGTKKVNEIPNGVKQAILILVGQWYENRQEAIIGRSVSSIPMTATYLMDRYKVQTLGIDVC
tara:strand:+ start:1963 stop:2568 length:606 start_codon:yes stop_codon:yes gene_type:complete